MKSFRFDKGDPKGEGAGLLVHIAGGILISVIVTGLLWLLYGEDFSTLFWQWFWIP